MPARTNDFQRLVRLVQQAFAPENATITESAMVPDALGFVREIDVLIEGEFGTYRMKIAVEAKDFKRPIDKTIIEQLASKYRQGDGVQVNQIVVVAANGFTRSAKDFSKRSGIKLFTLKEAKETNWKGMMVRPDSSLNFAMGPHFHDVRIEPSPTNIAKPLLLSSQLVCSCCGREHGVLRDQVAKWTFGVELKKPEIQKLIKEGLAKSPNGNLMLHLCFTPVNRQIKIGQDCFPVEKIFADVHVASSQQKMKVTNYVQTSESGVEQILQRAVVDVGNRRFELIIPHVPNSRPEKIILNIESIPAGDSCAHVPAVQQARGTESVGQDGSFPKRK